MSDSQPAPADLPTPETLGGIYVCVEAKEDLTVVPGQIPPTLLPAELEPNGTGMRRQDPCLNLCVGSEDMNRRPKPKSEEQAQG
jgi:hypothetical protein